MSCPFVPFEVSRYNDYKKYWLQCEEYSSDMSFVILWAWRDYFGYEISWEPELLWMRQTKPCLKWLPPVGNWRRGDWEQLLLEHVGEEADFTDVPKALVGIWQAQLGSKITALEDRNAAEYLYNMEELATLAGNRHMKRRNRVNKFRRQYAARYLPLTPDMTDRLKELQKQWIIDESEWATDMLRAESRGVLEVLDHWQELNLTGGAIELDGRLIAYTLAEPVDGKTMMVHYEKGLPEYREVYQVINKDFSEIGGKGFAISNREEDLGDPGLRQAKLAYFPCGFIEKYKVHWNARG